MSIFVGKNGMIIKIDEKSGNEELVAKFKSYDFRKNAKDIAKQMNEIKDIPRNEKEFQKVVDKLPKISKESWKM